MKSDTLPSCIEIRRCSAASDSCYEYAVEELVRIFRKVHVTATISPEGPTTGNSFHLSLSWAGKSLSKKAFKLPSGLFPDAFLLDVESAGIAIVSPSSKGILNGVYALAERLGFVFLMPGDQGEWAPETVRRLEITRGVCNPRFRHRGVYFGGLTYDFPIEEWLTFYAKLRFNSVCFHGPTLEDRSLLQRLGMRAETGGHGYRELLPRALHSRRPDLFRMDQPADFGGKRLNDFNSCAVNPEAQMIMRDNFRKQAIQSAADGFYALHRWPDDLPGGGWCLCPHCRGMNPSDQAMLAMCNLARAVREEKLPLRVPMLAYHDTMVPGGNISPAKETFLLFAPRERCYGHRLDDPRCARNRFYMDALERWMKKYRGIGDAHTFEYYFDQILFRGIYPYLPGVIAGDMNVYERKGIESHMALHIAGPAVAPEWNMLFFAQNLWDATLTPSAFSTRISGALGRNETAAAWKRYLDARARIFTMAMRMCDHEINVYLDYRWLPENTKPFGRKMVGVYRQSSKNLAASVSQLEKAAAKGPSKRLAKLAAAEAARTRFEAAELAVMSHQQDSVNQASWYMVTAQPSALRAAIAAGENVVRAFKPAYQLARKAQISPKTWYIKNVNRWITKETRSKIKVWKKALDAAH